MAARILFTAANTYEDIEGSAVGDFGCGTGMLSLGCNFLGAGFVTGFDVDQDALDIAWVNCQKMEVFDIDLVMTDITSLGLQNGWFKINLTLSLIDFTFKFIRFRYCGYESAIWH